MKNLILYILCSFLFNIALAENLSIRVFSNKSIKQLFITPNIGYYEIFANGKKIQNLNNDMVLNITIHGNKLKIKTLHKTLGIYSSIQLKPGTIQNTIRLKPINPNLKEREYDDGLIIKGANKQIIIINKVDIEKYIAGVVETEAGYNRPDEYYKVQAILCRTYALNQQKKHAKHGYNLCDLTHCQAYKGRCQKKQITSAVSATKNIVIFYPQLGLITAAFHSNCGGYTANSEDVWKEKLPYLRSVKDTFCINQKNAKWEKYIKTNDWLQYLKKHGYKSPNDSIHKQCPLFFLQPYRCGIYENHNIKLQTTKIRKDWKLRSSFFEITPKNADTLIFSGKGYGHGVGLCQEGAIEMAKHNYTYQDIITFYYKGVKLIDYHTLKINPNDYIKN